MPNNLKVYVDGKKVDLMFGQPVYKEGFQNVTRNFVVDSTLPIVVEARENQEWSKVNQAIVDAIYKKSDQNGEEEEVTYIVNEDFTPEWKASLQEKLRKTLKSQKI